MIKERDFIQNKEIALKKLESQKKKVLVDKEIIGILDIINSNDNYYTSSSCYGRLFLIQLTKNGDKLNAKFLCKLQRKI